MKITVHLNDSEIAICRMLGNLRSMVARGSAVKDRKMGSQSGIDIDEDGVMGEYAFCKHFNIFFDPSASPRSGSYDCLFKGHRIDIKTTRYRTGKLTSTLKINPDVDIYVLAIIDEKSVDFVGWLKSKDLCKSENIVNLGHGDGYAVSQENLKKWKKTN